MALFLPVRSGFVVQHLTYDFSHILSRNRDHGPQAQSQSVKKTYRIKINTHPNLLGLLAQLHQILFRPPFRRLCSLLVELTDIIEVVNIVSVRFLTSTALARRRDPNAVDPCRLKARKGLFQTFPMSLVGRDVPFESLEEASVLRRWFLICKKG